MPATPHYMEILVNLINQGKGIKGIKTEKVKDKIVIIHM